MLFRSKKSLVIDWLVKWRINEPRQFIRNNGVDLRNLDSRLSPVIQAAFNEEVTKRTVRGVLAAEREKVMNDVKTRLADERGFGVGDRAVDYLTRQIIEALFHSRHVDEVFSEDHTLRKSLRDVLNQHLHVDSDLDVEVRKRIKNLQEGTQSWEVEYQKVMQDLKRLKGLDA